jgi:Flp pilus assembly pilin Flp
LTRVPAPAFAGASPPPTCERTSRQQRSTCFHESGQGLIEYGLILVMMAVVCIISLLLFGSQLSSLLSLIASAV